MPCEGPSPNEQLGEMSREVTFLSRVLCAVLTELEKQQFLKGMGLNSVDDAFTRIDWKEAGTTRKSAERWWKRHKAEDERRRKDERRERTQRKLRKSALAKLTPKERMALRIIREDE